MKIELVYADITAETTDAIVNAANAGLYAGSGVCGAIHAAAGPELNKACMALPGRIVDAETGEELSEEQIAADRAAEEAHYIKLRARLTETEQEYDVDKLSDREVVARLMALRGGDDTPLSDEELSDEELEALLDDPFADVDEEFEGSFQSRRTYEERCPEGDAIATSGFELPAEHVIHAVGPIWHGGDNGEVEALDSVHRAIIRVADELGAKSISLPAISTGIFGFPLSLAAPTAVQALEEAGAESGVNVARITVIDRTNYNAFAGALGLPLEEETVYYAWVDPQAQTIITEPTDDRDTVGEQPREGTVLAMSADEGTTWSLADED